MIHSTVQPGTTQAVAAQSPLWVCSQIGAREHYAIPRALSASNRLHTLYTDIWSAGWTQWLRCGPAAARSFAARSHPEVPRHKVVCFNRHFMVPQLLRRVRAQNKQEEYLQHLRVGQTFARLVRDKLQRQAAPHGFIGYDTGCLETVQWLADLGIPTLVGQVDPGVVEEDLVRREWEKWPGWQSDSARIPDVYWQRLAAEWETATAVIVNSSWSRRCLMQQGVAPDKIFVLPLAYNAPVSPLQRHVHHEPLKVLWLGQVILRKGIQYLIEAARLLSDRRIQILVAGPVGISQSAVASAPGNVTFLGPMTRDRASSLYPRGDVFVLPTISDGFAITQLEAMAHGLPVIATPNCGEVVTDGQDGLIVPPGDARALAEALTRLDEDRQLLCEMSERAVEKSRQFTLPRLSQRLMALMDRFSEVN